MSTLPRYAGTGTDFYVAPPEVAEIVQLAIDLGRPLLVEGEAGCGKTLLASSVAQEVLGSLDELVKISVKSTSQARDLLYRFDALRRLQDAQNPDNPTAQHVYPYLSLGPLGDVIHQGRRKVVLLDEIDKADIDFPNDLLDVLDRFQFQIDDLPLNEEDDCLHERYFGRTVELKDDAIRPIVIITSNREKRLPEAFLRRCLYVRLRFPERVDTLIDIVRKNTGLTEEAMGREILEAVVKCFKALRATARSADAEKLPSTSELIDWVQIVHWKGETVESIEADPDFPPYWETLFKTFHDLDAYPAAVKSKRGAKP